MPIEGKGIFRHLGYKTLRSSRGGKSVNKQDRLCLTGQEKREEDMEAAQRGKHCFCLGEVLCEQTSFEG